MVPQARPFIAVLAEILDFRSPHGRHHALGAILAVACRAMRCGSRSEVAILFRTHGDKHNHDP
jgi:hypothetical protein